MHTHDWNVIGPEFLERAHRMVWCSVATTDAQGRPRSRILHPIWEGQSGWITADPRSPKGRDIARNPYVSLGYVSDVFKPAYADCHAEWVDDRETQQYVWDLLRNADAPLGFDPGLIYSPIGVEEADKPMYGLLKLTPYRLTISELPGETRTWTPGS